MSAGTSGLAKALIINLDRENQRIECMFNPGEYTFSKSTSWTHGGGSGADMPQIEFVAGQPAILQMQLFFDTFASGDDVRLRYTDAIWELTHVDRNLADPKTGKARPPFVRFVWGKSWTFDAVITAITQRFTLFLSDGTPVRATLDVTFQQIRDARQLKPQNPTSGGEGGDCVWTVTAGDSLLSIAYRVYGDANQWRRIAEANGLTNVRRLQPGMTLKVPHARR